jgi:primosomal protein N''
MYSKKIADLIIAGMRDGRFMGDVAGELGFTVRVVNKWKHANEDFADRLLKSRADGVYSALDTAKENLMNAITRDEILKAKEMLNQIRWEAEKLVAAFQPVVKSEVKHEGPQIAVIRWEDAGDVANHAEQTVPPRAQAKNGQKPRKRGLHKADVKPQGTKAIH